MHAIKYDLNKICSGKLFKGAATFHGFIIYIFSFPEKYRLLKHLSYFTGQPQLINRFCSDSCGRDY